MPYTSLRKRKISYSAASVWLRWHQGRNVHNPSQMGRRENSPSNKQRTKRLHPGKRWRRETGSSENRGRTVSIDNAPRAITVHATSRPDLAFCPPAQNQQHLNCVFRKDFWLLLLWMLQKKIRRWCATDLCEINYHSCQMAFMWVWSKAYLDSVKQCGLPWQQHTSEESIVFDYEGRNA